ncbi:hypothetical protein [Hahella sp. HN01]|uniref:hypothetical protein n=1 Tax=Hahella sp. HN01 TaxID=2847262 RepID=UPI001C1F15B8|nr:hypothetical protein [Hahella sp. HN01]MBU6951752.1 hypothetical protein [Hahella sp. HN01]
MPSNKKPEKDTITIDAAYPEFQLSKALQNNLSNPSQSSGQKVARWEKILASMYSGELNIGSRTPVSNTPAWVTLEVATGGFATGNFLAGAPLTENEIAFAKKLSLPINTETRAALNSYFLSEEGVNLLNQHISEGRFSISVPEEGALAIVAWLLEHGDVSGAKSILAEILPFFSELKFYPNLSGQFTASNGFVFLQPVRSAIEKLNKVEANKRITAQEEAIRIWIPLYDQLVGLLIETVESELPSVRVDDAGKPVRDHLGHYDLKGGFPGKTFPAGWTERATSLSGRHEQMASQHILGSRRLKAGSAHARMLAFLRQCIDSPTTLHERDRGYVRLHLARYIAKRGAPGEEKQLVSRLRQSQQCRPEKYHEIAKILVQRLLPLPQDKGLECVRRAIAPIASDESTHNAPAGSLIPRYLAKKVERTQIATIYQLIQQGYITSADTIANVLPQLSANIRASCFDDSGLKNIYSSIYQAFRQRRSLLLINLQNQVQLTELPWISNVEKYRNTKPRNQELAITILSDIVILALVNFPYSILPNKLLQEIRSLADQAKLKVPIVDEIAADIFMGEFTQKYANACEYAAELLQDTLYARYYNVDYSSFLKNTLFGGRSMTAKNFSNLCSKRAGAPGKGWSVASNAVIIEQQQILTTQNLAVLFQALGLKTKLGENLSLMVKDCFKWVCRRQQLKMDSNHAGLNIMKKSAYAWRQMIFFLTQLPPEEHHDHVSWMQSHLSEQAPEFRVRFAPVMTGLQLAVNGQRLQKTDSETIQFLGWAVGKHPLMSTYIP